MTRYLSRDRAAIAAALLAPLAAAAILLPFRASWPNTNVALLLVVVVVAVAAIGNRAGGGIAAIGLQSGSISSSPCPMSGSRSAAPPMSPRLSCCWWSAWRVSQLAAYARRLKVIAITDAGYLAQIHETASLAQRARFPEAVVEHVREQLIGLLICRSAALSTGRCSVTRRGWSLTARCWLVMAAGMLRKRACPVRSWSCGRSATASTTASSC